MSRNPFRIEGPAVVNFSGGRTSAFLLYRILEAHHGTLPPDVHVCFQNTGVEREETLDFVHACQQRFDVPVVWQEYRRRFDPAHYEPEFLVGSSSGPRSKHPNAAPHTLEVTRATAALWHARLPVSDRINIPFWNLLVWMKEYRAWKAARGFDGAPILPNVAQRICTNELKMKTASRWMRGRGYGKDYLNVLGIRADEPHRLSKARGGQFGEAAFPLAEAGVTKQDVQKFWRASPFDLQLDPESDEGNCTLCFMKRRDKIETIMRKTSAHDSFWIAAEELTGTVFRRDRPSYAALRANLPIIPTSYEGDAAVDCYCGAPD